MATTMRWSTRGGLLGTLVDAALPKVSPEMAGRFHAVARVHGELSAEIEQAAGNPELTELGRSEAIRRTLARSQEALAPHEREVERLDAEAAGIRARASATPRSERSEMAELMIQLEVRRHLADVDRLLLPPKYLSAIEQNDWDTVRALEEAPRALALLSDEARRQGSDAKVAKSALAPKLAETEAARDTLRGIVTAAKAELGRLARDRGFDAA